MPPKTKSTEKTVITEKITKDTCDQCGLKCSPRPYNASTGKVIYCCEECYGYGTDGTYTPSQSESSDIESDDVKSESDKTLSDDDDDDDEDDD